MGKIILIITLFLNIFLSKSVLVFSDVISDKYEKPYIYNPREVTLLIKSIYREGDGIYTPIAFAINPLEYYFYINKIPNKMLDYTNIKDKKRIIIICRNNQLHKLSNELLKAPWIKYNNEELKLIRRFDYESVFVYEVGIEEVREIINEANPHTKSIR